MLKYNQSVEFRSNVIILFAFLLLSFMMNSYQDVPGHYSFDYMRTMHSTLHSPVQVIKKDMI